MIKIIGIKLSKHESAFGVVRAVEQALMELTEREVELDNGDRCPLIYIIQAIRWEVGTYRDPWSKSYPTFEEAVRKCRESTPVEIQIV